MAVRPASQSVYHPAKPSPQSIRTVWQQWLRAHRLDEEVSSSVTGSPGCLRHCSSAVHEHHCHASQLPSPLLPPLLLHIVPALCVYYCCSCTWWINDRINNKCTHTHTYNVSKFFIIMILLIIIVIIFNILTMFIVIIITISSCSSSTDTHTHLKSHSSSSYCPKSNLPQPSTTVCV